MAALAAGGAAVLDVAVVEGACRDADEAVA